MVLSGDHKVPRGLWKMGRVIAITSSDDDLMRKATVYSQGKTLNYAIVHLIKLFTPGVENDPPSNDPIPKGMLWRKLSLMFLKESPRTLGTLSHNLRNTRGKWRLVSTRGD